MSNIYKKTIIKILNEKTGELEPVKYTESVQRTAKDKRKFMKLYLENSDNNNPLEIFLLLPRPTQRLVSIVLKAYSKSAKDTDEFYLNYQEACTIYAYTKSKPEYYKAMKHLKDIGFITKLKLPSLFKINDTWVYNGRNKNHLQLV